MTGMNLSPGQSYSLADRFICGKCHEKPKIVSAKADGSAVIVKLSCHGEMFEKAFSKSELGKTIAVFTDEPAEDVSSLVNVR